MGKVSSGQRFKIGASDWNSFVDAAAWVKQQQHNESSSAIGSAQKNNVVLVKNTSSDTSVAMFRPIALTGLAVEPNQTTGAPLVNAMIPFTGLKANASRYNNVPLAITQEPIAGGKVGKALTSGITLAFVDIEDANHGFAILDLSDGSLKSSPRGFARILYKPSETGSDRLCVIDMGVAHDYEGMFTVVPWGDGVVKVLDGSGFSATDAGVAWVNGESFNISARTFSVSASSETYWLYMQGTATKSGDTYTINQPTLECSTTVPVIEDLKCKILIARIQRQRIVQEHQGQIYATIYGDCDS